MTIYYVATDGDNNANGTVNQPFRSIQQALDSGLQPGDEVVVRAGTYQEALYINQGGSAAGNVTLRAEVPGTVVLDPPSNSFNAISINDNYVTVSGFRIVDAVGDGIEANNVHHIEVVNNVISGSGESGIQFNGSDFILVDGNITFDNASDGWFSGISIYQNRNITGDTSRDEFRTVVSNNISYDNITKTGDHTDGNGIIIDDFQSTQTSGFPNYTFPTLVENNLVYGNGGKGIQVVWSDGVTVRNNTAYHNNNDDLNVGTWRGEISNSQSSDNTFINNIAVADPGINSGNTAIDNTSYGGYRNDNVTWISNLTFNGQNGDASVRTDGNNPVPRTADGNLLGIDPGFLNAPNNFRLSEGSPAINAGSDAYGLPGADLDGLARAIGIVDLGAYEAGSNAPAPSTPSTPSTPAVPTSEAPLNTAPDAKNDSGFLMDSDTSIRIATAKLLENDTDPDGDTLSVVELSNGSNGTVRLSGETGIFTPEEGFSGSASFDVTVSDGKGGTDTSTVFLEVAEAPEEPIVTAEPTPSAPSAPSVPSASSNDDSTSIWDNEVPDIPVDPDTAAVTLGLEFTADVDATLEGLRLYLTDANSGLESIDLWSKDGSLLAHADVSPSGGTGWQTLYFDSPVDLLAGESYVASYFTTSGGYAVSESFFTAPADAGPVSYGADAGVYSYGTDAQFPDQTYVSSNYWVDLALAPADNVIGEAGVVTQKQESSDDWHTVTFEHTLDDPTVVMSGMTQNGTQPFTLRVRDVTSEGFEYQIDEWDYLDGRHTTEEISWIAIESGTHKLADGRTISAGNTSVGDTWEDVGFDDGVFDAAPVVFGQSSDDGNELAVADRIKNVTADGFKTRLFTEEASEQQIESDDFDWIAIESGGAAKEGSLAGSTGRVVSHKGSGIDLADGFAAERFAFLTDKQTTYGRDTSTIKVTDLSDDSVMISVLEERSQDKEMRHVREDVAFAGFEADTILGTTLAADDSLF